MISIRLSGNLAFGSLLSHVWAYSNLSCSDALKQRFHWHGCCSGNWRDFLSWNCFMKLRSCIMIALPIEEDHYNLHSMQATIKNTDLLFFFLDIDGLPSFMMSLWVLEDLCLLFISSPTLDESRDLALKRSFHLGTLKESVALGDLWSGLLVCPQNGYALFSQICCQRFGSSCQIFLVCLFVIWHKYWVWVRFPWSTGAISAAWSLSSWHIMHNVFNLCQTGDWYAWLLCT